MNDASPVAVSTIQYETDRVRVTEWRFEPRAETGWHRHEFDYVVVPMSTGDLLIKNAEGEQYTALSAGTSYGRDAGVEHNVINPNDEEFIFIEIEVK